ncbi:4,5:9,10-diseco-3-hydroxy-5,9,17-trioxoandrosta-1(10),2-diene-4-oate hydrolase [compost metagenome]
MSSFKNKSSQTSVGTAGALAGIGMALAGGATALWVRRQARKAQHDNPPLGQFVEVDGVRLHYVEKGAGPPVLLLHGNVFQLEDFIASGLLEVLARHHRVIVFDRPGFGHSDRPRDRQWTPEAQAALMTAALAKLGADPPVVVGHSWGALVALGMALDFPTAVRGLVLIGGYYYPTALAEGPLAAPAAIPVVGDAMRYTVAPLAGRLFLKQAVRKMFAPSPMPPNFFEVVPREMLLRPSQIKAAAEDAATMTPAAKRFRDRYASMEMPVTILAGAGDKIVDVKAHASRLHDELPRSTLVIAPGAGHMVHHAVPGDIAQAVESMSRGPGSLRLAQAGPSSSPDDAGDEVAEDARTTP